MRRLDIGIASYRNPDKLRATLASVERQSTTDWRCFVIHNPKPETDAEREQRAHVNRQAAAMDQPQLASEEDQTCAVIREAVARNNRFMPIWLERNVGYVGAVNRLFALADSEYIAYCDNDIEIRTHGWDERFAAVLEANPEAGWIFPGKGHFPLFNGRYHECLWNAGYCWMTRPSTIEAVARREDELAIRMFNADWSGAFQSGPWEPFDTALGHHEEVDFMIRLRLAGFQTAACPDVHVIHHETATRADDAVHKPGGRIHDGVVRWMNKWNTYFCGNQLKYSMTAYDPRALRYTDWPPCALYLERYYQHHLNGLNARPETINVGTSGPMDLIKIPKPKDCYHGRFI